MSPNMTAEECRRKLCELEDLRRIVSFAPDKARLGAQCETVRQQCLRLERTERDARGEPPTGECVVADGDAPTILDVKG